MFFRKKNKPSDDRIFELKARVDSLRRPEEPRGKLLDVFLSGDDVVTSRDQAPPVIESRPDVPASPAPRGMTEEEMLEVELRRYIARYETPDSSEGPDEERQAG